MRLLAPARRSLSIVAAAVCAVLALVATVSGRASTVAVTDRTTRIVTLAPGEPLAIAVTVGTVTITGDERRRDVRLDITRDAPTAEALARAPIDVTTGISAGTRVALTQRDGGADPAIRTDVVVSAPADLRVDTVAIAEGRLTLRRLGGDIRATVTRGSITAEDVSGVLRLETSIGPIEVTRAILRAGGLFRLRAFNGDVRLALAAPLADTRVMALALNGTIDSRVPLTLKDGWGPRWGETTIGRPDRIVSLDVVTGTIRIEAPSAR